MSGHRSHFRNVRFFDEANPDVVLGGLIQNGSLTEKNFLNMLQTIVLVTTAPIRVSAKDTGRVVSMVDTRLDVGDYMVSCKGRLGTVIVREFLSELCKVKSGSMTSCGSTASSRTMCPIKTMHFKMESVNETESVSFRVSGIRKPRTGGHLGRQRIFFR